MMIRPYLLILLLSLGIISCSKKDDPVPEVIPAHAINSNNGVIIDLEWTTGGSASQAINESDLDLYLDMGNRQVEASENSYSFEAVHLKDIYKDGTYDVYVGALMVNRRTEYSLFISAPNGDIIHRFSGYFLAGEQGEVRYLRIRKQGSLYTLLDI